MKKLVCLSLLCTAFSFLSQAQHSCCTAPSTQQFALMAQKDDFKSLHLTPLPYRHESQSGRDTLFKTPDGQTAHGFYLPASKPSNKYLLVIHEWWGLNDYIKKESEKRWKDLGDVNVLALDMYDGKVAAVPDSASAYMGQLSTARAEAIIKGAKDLAGPKARIATLGWCFGGGWSLQAAILLEKQAAGCVIYYGMPEQEVSRLKTLHTEVLGIFATQDKHINPEVVKTFEANMKLAGKKLTVKNYDAVHAFANPSNPNYNKEASEDAYKLTLAFLKEKLK